MSTKFIFLLVGVVLMGLQPLYADVRPAGNPATAKTRVPVGTAKSGKGSIQEQLDALRTRVEVLEAKTGITAPEKIVACSDLKLGQMCKTSKDKCFKLVDDKAFGPGMQEMGDDCKHEGTIWARQLQQTDVNYDTAQKACPRGTHPPTKEDFVRLRESVGTKPNPQGKEYFDPSSNQNKLSDHGRKELYSLLPDMERHWFWSSSAVDNDSAYYFDGNSGGVINDNRDNNDESVRCVR